MTLRDVDMLGRMTLVVLALAGYPASAVSSDDARGPLRPLPLTAFENVENIVDYQLSSDGKTVALSTFSPRQHYVGNGADFRLDGLLGKLSVIDVASGAVTKIGLGDADATHPQWSPDGQQLAFVVGVADAARLWVWSRSTGQSRAVSTLVPRTLPRTGSSTTPRWLPDGRAIVMAVMPEGMTNEAVGRKIAEGSLASSLASTADASSARVRIYDSTGAADGRFHPENSAIADLYLGDLALIDVASGTYRTLISRQRVVSYSVAPEGRRVVFSTFSGLSQDSALGAQCDIAVVDIQTARTRVLVHGLKEQSSFVDAGWSPDGRWLAFFGGVAEGAFDYAFVDSRTGALRRAGGRLRSAIQAAGLTATDFPAPKWISNNQAFVTMGTPELQTVWRIDVQGHSLGVAPIDLSGKTIKALHTLTAAPSTGTTRLLAQVRDLQTKSEGFAVYDAQRNGFEMLYDRPVFLGNQVVSSDGGDLIVYSEERADAVQQLWATDGSFGRSRQLTALNSTFAEISLGKSRLVQWSSADGEALQGALLLPSGYTSGKRYPLIVRLYGGARASEALNTFGLSESGPYMGLADNMQLFATRGYAVLYADTLARVGRTMSDIAQSVLPGVNRVVDEGIADPQRLGIFGHSYGGYSVLSVLVQTNRFKAAVSSAGLVNLINAYSALAPDGTVHWVGWVEDGQGRMGGSLWEQRNRFIENSPLFYLDRVTTPLLLLHGTQDTAVSFQESNAAYISLRRLGKTVRYVQYLGEGHNLAGAANLVDQSTRMIEWFDRFLKTD